MINRKELMIGNRVWVPNMNADVLIASTEAEVLGIDIFSHIHINENPEIDMPSIPTSHIEPIPLTPDILVRCGFDKNNNWYSMHVGENTFLESTKTNGVYLTKEVNDLPVHLPPSDEIKHLHSLQNLYLALTGKELEIKL